MTNMAIDKLNSLQFLFLRADYVTGRGREGVAGQAVSGICLCFIVTRQVFSKRWFLSHPRSGHKARVESAFMCKNIRLFIYAW